MESRNELVYIYFQEHDESLEELIAERRRFENELYDYLTEPLISFLENINGAVNGVTGANEAFWEPVKVGYKDVKDLPDDIGEDTCVICMESHLNFKKVRCCQQKMCNGCCYEWFKESVKCPYCFQDLREFQLN